MIRKNNIISVFLILLLFVSKGNAEIKDALFATVGNKAITNSDIVQEVKTMLILQGKGFSEDKRKVLQNNAIQSLIGHESLTSTQIYTHVTIGGLKETIKKSHPRGEK